MARKRFLSPDIWSDASFVKLIPQERLLFIGLITLADDEGRLRASPSYLKGELFPQNGLGDEEVQRFRDRTVRQNRNILLYKVAGVEYIQLLNWTKYQSPSHPTPSRLPPPRRFKTAPNTPESFANGSRKHREIDAKDSRNSRDLGMGRGVGRGLGSSSSSSGTAHVGALRREPEDEIAHVIHVYENNIGTITAIIAQELADIATTYPPGWFEAAVKEAVEANARSLRYVKAILQRWERDGFRTPLRRPPAGGAAARAQRPLPTAEELKTSWGETETEGGPR